MTGSPEIPGMTEIRTVTTLRSKRAEIISTIAQYEKPIAQARADLSHVNACIALFEVSAEPGARSALRRYAPPVRPRRPDETLQRIPHLRA